MKKFYNFIKRRRNYLVLFLILGISSMVVLFTKNSPTDRETFERFLNNHPYTQFNGMTETDLEGIPKADRPDLAHMQNFLMTMDPNLGYPPVEKTKFDILES
jgi:uncharacterized membrane protein YkgB